MNNIILHIESNSKKSNLIIKDNSLIGIGLDNNLNLFNKNSKNKKIYGNVKKNKNKFYFLPKLNKFLINCNKLIKIKQNYTIIIANNKFKINDIKSNILILENLETKKLYKIKNSLTIGRNKNNKICIKNKKISNIHAKIVYKNNEFYIIDNNSVNGTFILPDKYIFKLDDKLKIGNLDVIVSKYKYGIYHEIGKRPTFEDTFKIKSNLSTKFKNEIISYFAVFDGHGGNETSKYCELFLHKELEKLINCETKVDINILKKCITQAIENLDKTIYTEKIQSGTTANICLIFNNNLLCANVGDSRSILCRNNNVIPLSFDHKPNNEHEYNRIIKTNGFVQNQRLNGRLAVSRAIGDNMFKDLDINKSPLISTPEILEFILSKNDKFIVIACDGLWDVMTNEEVKNYINNIYNKFDLNTIAKKIVEHAIYNLHSSDNVTVFIVNLL